jgi:hypothetical protein
MVSGQKGSSDAPFAFSWSAPHRDSRDSVAPPRYENTEAEGTAIRKFRQGFADNYRRLSAICIYRIRSVKAANVIG